MHTILFDVDGTLLLNGTIVNDTFRRSFATVCEVDPDTRAFSFAGMTDKAIFHRLLDGSGRETEAEELFAAFVREYPRQLAQVYPQAEGPHLLPGVDALVRALASRHDVALGLATGNVRETAYLKLGRFGLDDHFPAGGFGQDHLERWRVFIDAIAAVREHYGFDRGPRPWVVGDTHNDVVAARRVGARMLAVATGVRGAGDLSGADSVVEDLADTASVLELLLREE
jgi:phosphoglycolate phosphatase-like HAD superfamily hydrolase